MTHRLVQDQDQDCQRSQGVRSLAQQLAEGSWDVWDWIKDLKKQSQGLDSGSKVQRNLVYLKAN